jgi:MarR family transcriptional regulator for hemolysin
MGRERGASPGKTISVDDSERHLINFRRASAREQGDEDLFPVTRSIVTASRRWRKIANERVKVVGQTMARWETLFLVAYSDAELTQGELARLIDVEGPTMVRMLDSLGRDGLIERTQSETDRRVTLNSITPRGREVISEIMDITNALRSDLLKDIPRDKLAITTEVLTMILRRLDEMR